MQTLLNVLLIFVTIVLGIMFFPFSLILVPITFIVLLVNAAKAKMERLKKEKLAEIKEEE